MNQNLSLYRIFYTVARSGNISRAADELFISQPALSKSIKKLEEALNVRLFIRSSKGVILTPEGKLLWEYVQKAFSSLDAAEHQLARMASPDAGSLRIGVSATLCRYMLLPYLSGFISAHPGIHISISCQSTNETLELLEITAKAVQMGSLCGLGKTAPNPVLSTLKHFRQEYEDHVFRKICPTGECKALARPEIVASKCKGCTACMRKCPVGAITGEIKKPHHIDAEKCIKCGACKQACKFGAIIGL